MLFPRSVRGESLVELIVALVILEVAGSAALAAALTVEGVNRRVTRGAADDVARWQGYRLAEIATGCVNAAAPDSQLLVFAATGDRPRFETVIRCGR